MTVPTGPAQRSMDATCRAGGVSGRSLTTPNPIKVPKAQATIQTVATMPTYG